MDPRVPFLAGGCLEAPAEVELHYGLKLLHQPAHACLPAADVLHHTLVFGLGPQVLLVPQLCFISKAMLLDLVLEPAVGTNFLPDIALDVIHDEVDNLVESPYFPEVRAILLLPHLEPAFLPIPWTVLFFLLQSPPVLGCPLDRLVEEVLFPHGQVLGLRVLVRRGGARLLFGEKLVLVKLVLQLVNEGVLLVKQTGVVGADLLLHPVEAFEALALLAEGAADR